MLENANQAQFQAHLLDVVEQAMIVTDLQGKVVYWNKYAEHLYGWSRHEAVGRWIRELITPTQVMAEAEAVFAKMRKGESWSGEFVLKRRDGSQLIADVTNSPILDDKGQLVGIIGMSRDATARHNAQDALKASEEFNRSILESTNDCIKVIDLEGNLISMNGPGLCLMEIDDLSLYVGKPWTAFWEEEVRPLAQQAIRDAASGSNAHFSGPCRTAKGTLKYWDVIVSPVLGNTGKPKHLVSVSRDITDQRQSLEILRRNEEEYRALFYQSAIGKAEFDFQTGKILRVNPKLCAILDYSESELTQQRFVELIHRDDLAREIAQYDQMVSAQGTEYTSTYRVYRRDGRARWIEAHISLVRDSNSRPISAIVAVQDITERRHADEEQKLLAALGPALTKPESELEIAQNVAQAIVPSFADWCTIGIVKPGPEVHLVASAHSSHLSDSASTGILPGVTLNFTLSETNRPLVYAGKAEIYSQLTREMFEQFHPARQSQLSQMLEQGLQSLLYVPLIVRGQVEGVIALGLMGDERQFDTADLALAEEVAHRVALAFDNIHLLQNERQSRLAAELYAERLARLQHVTAALSKATTPIEVIQLIVDEGLKAFGAQAGAVNLLNEYDQTLEIYHSNGYPAEIINKNKKLALSSNMPCAIAVRNNQPLWFTSREQLLQAYPELVNEVYQPNERAIAIMPLRTERRILGALEFGFASTIQFDSAERDYLLTIANQCAQALERAQFYASEQVARQIAESQSARMRALQTITSALSNALTPEQVAMIVVQQGTVVLGARAGFVAMLNTKAAQLEVIAQHGHSPVLAETIRKFALTDRTPVIDAVRKRQAQWYESPEALVAGYDGSQIPMNALDHAWADIPLIVENRVLGAIGLSFSQPRHFSADDKAFMIAMAQQCAQALERAHLFEAEQLARAKADRAADRSAFMAESSQFVTTSMDFETRLNMVTSLAVPALADWCLLTVLTDDGQMTLASVAHVDPTKTAHTQAYFDQLSTAVIEQSNSINALKSGRSFLLQTLRDEDYVRLAKGNPAHLQRWRESGTVSLLGVPMIAHGNLYGLLFMGRNTPSPNFNPEDLAMIEEWVTRMALNVDNARLYRELQTLNADLEQRVAMRTAELQGSRDQLRNFAARLQAAREDERARVSREVHDVIGQILTGLKMDISALGRRLQQENSPAVSKIKDINGLLDEAIKSVRKVATELRPAILDNFGLVAAVEWQLREFEARSEIACDFVCNAEQVNLSNDRATALFRLIQEALTNIARHADATEVSVTLNEQDGWLDVQVTDNGRGITEAELLATKSLGLLGMRERVNLLDGEIEFSGQPNKGTTVKVRLPLETTLLNT